MSNFFKGYFLLGYKYDEVVLLFLKYYFWEPYPPLDLDHTSSCFTAVVDTDLSQTVNMDGHLLSLSGNGFISRQEDRQELVHKLNHNIDIPALHHIYVFLCVTDNNSNLVTVNGWHYMHYNY